MYGIAFKVKNNEYFAYSLINGEYQIICFEDKHDAYGFLNKNNNCEISFYVSPLFNMDKLNSEKYMGKKRENKIGVLYAVSYKDKNGRCLLRDNGYQDHEVLKIFKKKKDAKNFINIWNIGVEEIYKYKIENLPEASIEKSVKFNKKFEAEYFIVNIC